MTGEMSWIKPNGEDSNGDVYEVHAKVARALRCRLHPFDVYIGPYIDTLRGHLFISTDDGFLGVVCLWPGGVAPAYRIPIVAEYAPFDSVEEALVAARQVLREARKR